jgi:hypothetical protein
MPEKFTEVTQKVIIRPMFIQRTSFLRGKFYDKNKICHVITKGEQLYVADQAEKYADSDIFTRKMGKGGIVQHNIEYLAYFDEAGQINSDKMSQRDQQLMQVADAWARSPQMQHAEATSLQHAKKLNPNLESPYFIIEYVGRLNISKVLTNDQKNTIWSEFKGLEIDDMILCCYYYGHNPIAENGIAVRTGMMNTMADFNNGILQRDENREDFLNNYMPNREEAMKQSIINAAFKLNIVSYQGNAYYCADKNIGLTPESARSYIANNPQMYEYIKTTYAAREIQKEDDLAKGVKKDAYQRAEAVRKTQGKAQIDSVDKVLEEARIRAEAQQYNVFWHHKKAITQDLYDQVQIAKDKQLTEATNL